MCRPLPEKVYRDKSREAPLLSMRQDLAAEELGETVESLGLLERLLRCESSVAHEQIASLLWDRYETLYLCGITIAATKFVCALYLHSSSPSVKISRGGIGRCGCKVSTACERDMCKCFPLSYMYGKDVICAISNDCETSPASSTTAL